MIVVDSSVWVAAFRDREGTEAGRLAELLEEKIVALPVPVRIELLSGTPRRHFATMRQWLSALPSLVPERETWRRVEEWVAEAKAAGHRFRVADLLIAATAADHGASIWSLDADFARMQKLGFVKIYPVP